MNEPHRRMKGRFMGTFKMIVYPFALCLGTIIAVSFLGMAMFGLHSNDWTDWQYRLVNWGGTFAGVGGAIVGLWLAIRSERRAIH
jgi:hypothetical protein